MKLLYAYGTTTCISKPQYGKSQHWAKTAQKTNIKTNDSDAFSDFTRHKFTLN